MQVNSYMQHLTADVQTRMCKQEYANKNMQVLIKIKRNEIKSKVRKKLIKQRLQNIQQDFNK